MTHNAIQRYSAQSITNIIKAIMTGVTVVNDIRHQYGIKKIYVAIYFLARRLLLDFLLFRG